LFAHELEPWHRARDSGRTLEEHIMSVTMLTLEPSIDRSFEELPTHKQAPKRSPAARQRQIAWAIRIAVVLVLFGTAYFVARWWLAPLPITAGSRSG
jgi:fatty acid desaturase